MALARLFPITALVSLGALSLVLTGCGASAEPAATAAATTTAAPIQTPTATAQPTPTATAGVAAADATCETLVSEDLLAELTAQNWTYREAAFTIGDVTLDAGMQCTWADFTTASGNLLLFGWAPITNDEAVAAQDALVAQGWTVEQGTEGVYVTEDATQAPTVDENGYGMTYEFGDGWVTVSDTKQNLLLIERPAV